MYTYQLEPYKGIQSRYSCPGCNRRKTFTRYINTHTGQHLAAHVGKCDRTDHCGYHLTPREFLPQTGGYSPPRKPRRCLPKPVAPPANELCITPEYVNESFDNYPHNNFAQYLITRFGFDVANGLVGSYRIGTSSHWLGATVFWQLDANCYARTGKIMLYNKHTGKRVKQPHNHITWAHTLIINELRESNHPDTSYQNFKLRQCLFGEHLLPAEPLMPVAIVESEKTAIIASAMMPAFIWLACGSLDGLNTEKCKVLKGRQVMLFPDVNGYHKWLAKARELQRAIPAARFEVSAMLEQHATEQNRRDGVDIADVVF